jgi:phytanoyl-CoA hydroxylase
MATETASSRVAEDFSLRGFTVVRGFFSPGQVEEVHRNVARYVADVLPTLPKEEAFYETRGEPSSLKQLSRIDRHDRFFEALSASENLANLARDLLGGGDVRRHAMQWLKQAFRLAGAGRETPPHQDGFYFRITPNEAVTFWLALDPVDEENGCVRYVPGSHRRGLLAHGRCQTLGFSQSIADYGPADRAIEVAVSARPGDLIAHHSLTIHRADPNRSNRPRRALTAVYFSSDSRRDDDGIREYQSQLTSELERNGKI